MPSAHVASRPSSHREFSSPFPHVLASCMTMCGRQKKTSQVFLFAIVVANLLKREAMRAEVEFRNSTQFHAEELFIRSHCFSLFSCFFFSSSRHITRSFLPLLARACVYFSVRFSLYLRSLHRATYSLQIRPPLLRLIVPWAIHLEHT